MHTDTRYCTLLIWAVVLLLSEIRAIINDLDVILHGFMLQIINTTAFRIKRLKENRDTNITYICVCMFYELNNNSRDSH
jgi:hypothetical protein